MKRLIIESPERGQQALEDLSLRFDRRIKASPQGICPVDMLLNFVRTCHAQSCGKCTPCRVGLWQLSEMLQDIHDGKATAETLELLKSAAQNIYETADCAIGFETAKMVLDGIEGFRDDLNEHIQSGDCLYGIELAIPCTALCPAHVDVPGYISLVEAGRYKDAVSLIRKDNPFPSVCAYVCEHPCEKRCRRNIVDDAINICGIKRYAVDHAGDIAVPQCAESSGKKVAVVGGGPGGLTAAYYLTLMGHSVTVYEQRHELGGMLRYGIPNYRLPLEILDRDIQYILDSGVDVVTDVNVGDDLSMDELKEKYDAVYVSIGAHSHKTLNIPGEDNKNVISAVAMLRRIGEGDVPDISGKRVCVVGGGNVAMDATRTCLRLGAAHVSCVYRRRIADMTALPDEIQEAQAEGAEFRTLLAPVSVESDEKGNLKGLRVQPQIISYIGKDGRPSVRSAEQDTLLIPCDYIVVAIGQSINVEPFLKSGMKVGKRGVLEADSSSFVAGSGNVFAGGDAVSGPATVVRAVAAGKVAADNIDDFLGFDHRISSDIEVPNPPMTSFPPCGRVNLTNNPPENIKGNFDCVSTGMSEEGVKQECSRCLRCDCFGFGSFRGGRVVQW